MKIRTTLRRLRAARVLSAVVVLALAGSVAVAMGAIPNSTDGTVHLCYDSKDATGDRGGADLSIIDGQANTKGCSLGQSALTINQRGPQGLPGTNGKDSTVPGPPGKDSTVPGPAGKDSTVPGPPGKDSTVPGPPGPAGPATTATFAIGKPDELPVISGDALTRVVGKTLPAGSYALIATVNTDAGGSLDGDRNSDARCELREGAHPIGGAIDRRLVPQGPHAKRSLSLNGGAQVPTGGGEVSVWCASQDPFEVVTGAQIMILKIGGFS